MITLDGIQVVPTIFPDGTSQVWKIGPFKNDTSRVVFDFEHEGEVFHLLQLAMLLQEMKQPADLFIPFLPYGRQDKSVSNESTFALHAFGEILKLCNFQVVETIDAHSHVIGQYVDFVNSMPYMQIKNAIESTAAVALCFPDSGAWMRYLLGESRIVLDKKRDQLTGHITGMEVVAGLVPDSGDILIVDDICDGGRTFIEACKLLKSIQPQVHVHLYVSHGIFSKGLDVLREAGIERIFTKDGEVL